MAHVINLLSYYLQNKIKTQYMSQIPDCFLEIVVYQVESIYLQQARTFFHSPDVLAMD